MHRPALPLGRYVNALIYFKGLVPGHGHERFLPDGNVEIIVDLADRPEHIYDGVTLEPIQTFRGAWASGVRTGYLTLSSGHKSELFVVAFRKGMAFPFFPVPMQEMSDRVVDVDQLWNGRINGLRQGLLEARTPSEKFHFAEEFLLRMRRSSLDEHPCVEYAVKSLISAPENFTLGKLYDEIGYSKRHFIRLFSERVGVAPKTYSRLCRFQKAVQLIEGARSVDWSSFAHQCGFFDQAHFIHDFKHFSGFTPADYVRQKSTELNYVPLE